MEKKMETTIMGSVGTRFRGVGLKIGVYCLLLLRHL